MLPVNSPFVRTAITRLRTAEAALTRQTILETFSHWRNTPPAREDGGFHRVLALLEAPGGPVTVEELSQAVGVSERQLQRLFRDRAGVSPKLYLRFLRFERTYHYVLTNPWIPYAEIAFLYGYADEAHLIREFRSFCGATPRSLLATAAALY